MVEDAGRNFCELDLQIFNTKCRLVHILWLGTKPRSLCKAVVTLDRNARKPYTWSLRYRRVFTTYLHARSRCSGRCIGTGLENPDVFYLSNCRLNFTSQMVG